MESSSPESSSRTVLPAPNCVIAPNWETARLLMALRAGDEAVARPLWLRYAPSVTRIIRRTLGPRAAIDQVLHQVFCLVFHEGRRLEQGADLNLFVLRAVARAAQAFLRRRVLRWLRSVARSRRRVDASAGFAAPQPTESVLRFYRVLEHLGARDRVAFALHFIERLNIREVAAAIGESPVRAARRLRRCLATVLVGIKGDPVLTRLGKSGIPGAGDTA